MIEDILINWVDADNRVYAIKEKIKDLEHQQKLAETEVAEYMVQARDYMNANGILEETIEGEKFNYKLSFTKPRGSVKCPDSDAVPDDFCKIERKPELKKIKEYLDDGNTPNWATVEFSEPKVSYKIGLRK